ncbi:tRNA dihydrouridine synthase DusB [Melioribacteraceae bacterium 4301-Me]|uniref:tRNA dihydrouridine synthase DusB n=1 Tax=Pyranulibacter aquaticus TaxID=3163344 RepID=UPI00359B42A0
MFKVGKINIEKAILLAPMEDVTDVAFRKICKEYGADVVYTEFVNSDGLVRNNKKTEQKLTILDEERPIGIQIYGGNLQPMIEAAKIAESRNPDIIDINAGCWVKKVANRGAGAGLLKDPPYMQKMVEAIVKTVNIPVTVKTRIGWDNNSIHILEIAKRIEDAGAAAITIHGRTRSQGHSGEPNWEIIAKVKENISIPVALNGGVMSAEDAVRAFNQTNVDAVMIARGAIGNPWIFREVKELMKNGKIVNSVTVEERITTILRHLKYAIEIKGVRGAIIPFRKFYSGYLKGLFGAAQVRKELMKIEEYAQLEDLLLSYLSELKNNFEQVA